MTTPDVRAFYTTLGIELPGWPKLEAPTRCFAQPDAHTHNDRSPSCSINLASGAWNCHGCGAHGGAYDAALAAGLTPRDAMELLIANGLAQPRRDSVMRSRRPPALSAAKATPSGASRARLALADADVQSWAEMLDADSRLVRRLILERAWAPRIMRALQVGFDGARITFPIRNAQGHLRGMLRYDAFGRRDPKMRAVAGTRLGLIPHPSGRGLRSHHPRRGPARHDRGALGRSPGSRDPRNARLAPGVGAPPDWQTRHDRDGLRRTRPTSRRGDRGEPRRDRRRR